MSISRGYRTDFSSLSRPAPRDGLGEQNALPHARDTRQSRSDEATQDWFAAAERIGRDVDLDTSAHTLGAMLRRRGVPAATNLLCLALMYGPGRMPLRMITERAEAHGIAHVSEPALLRRLCNASVWLEHVADQMIGNRLGELVEPSSTDATLPTMIRFSTTAQLLPGPMHTGSMLPGSMHPVSMLATQLLSPFSGPSLRDQRAQQITAAREFIVDFMPWPADVFSDAQIHWLLCVRWSFVSSHLRDVLPHRTETDPAGSPVLGRARQQAHLLAALVSSEGG